MTDKAIRADLSQSGWLFKHPDCKPGWPEAWGLNTGKLNPVVFQLADEELHLNPVDDVDAANKLKELAPYVKHIQINPEGRADTWLIFSDQNKFLGQMDALDEEDWDNDDFWASIEPVDRHEWSRICDLAELKVDRLVDASAAYDPKIYIKPEYAEFIKQFNADFDPYF